MCSLESNCYKYDNDIDDEDDEDDDDDDDEVPQESSAP